MPLNVHLAYNLFLNQPLLQTTFSTAKDGRGKANLNNTTDWEYRNLYRRPAMLSNDD